MPLEENEIESEFMAPFGFPILPRLIFPDVFPLHRLFIERIFSKQNIITLDELFALQSRTEMSFESCQLTVKTLTQPLFGKFFAKISDTVFYVQNG